jgi:putative FmdB family regulatory protein
MIYEYRCPSCGQYFEVRATLAEKEAGLKPVCPKCQARNAEQVFTRVGLAFGRGGSAPPSFSGGGCCGPGQPC